jgi:hypothetical protein
MAQLTNRWPLIGADSFRIYDAVTSDETVPVKDGDLSGDQAVYSKEPGSFFILPLWDPTLRRRMIFIRVHLMKLL